MANPQTRNQQTSYSYRNLEIWERAQSFAERVIRETAKLPTGVASNVIARPGYYLDDLD